MVRVAGLHDQVDAGIDARKADGLSPSETIERIAERTRELGARQSASVGAARCGPRWPSTASGCSSCDELLRGGAGARPTASSTSRSSPCSPRSPSGPGRPFPYISNLSLSIGRLAARPGDGHRAVRAREGAEGGAAAVHRPRRQTPSSPLEAVIARHLDALFPGMELLRHAFFRVARDADFEVSDEADDLLRAVENELRQRRFGEVVRLEVGAVDGPRPARVPDRAAGDRGGPGGGRRGPARPHRPVADPRPRRLQRAARGAVDAGERRARSPPRTASPTCSPPCAPATSSCTTPTTRSPAASSGSWSRP